MSKFHGFKNEDSLGKVVKWACCESKDIEKNIEKLYGTLSEFDSKFLKYDNFSNLAYQHTVLKNTTKQDIINCAIIFRQNNQEKTNIEILIEIFDYIYKHKKLPISDCETKNNSIDNTPSYTTSKALDPNIEVNVSNMNVYVNCQRCTNLWQKNEDLYQSLDDSYSENDKLTKQIESKNQENNDLKEQLGNNTQEIENKTQEIENKTQLVNLMSIQLNDLKKQLDDKDKLLAIQTSKIDKMCIELAQSKAKEITPFICQYNSCCPWWEKGQCNNVHIMDRGFLCRGKIHKFSPNTSDAKCSEISGTHTCRFQHPYYYIFPDGRIAVCFMSGVCKRNDCIRANCGYVHFNCPIVTNSACKNAFFHNNKWCVECQAAGKSLKLDSYSKDFYHGIQWENLDEAYIKADNELKDFIMQLSMNNIPPHLYYMYIGEFYHQTF